MSTSNSRILKDERISVWECSWVLAWRRGVIAPRSISTSSLMRGGWLRLAPLTPPAASARRVASLIPAGFRGGSTAWKAGWSHGSYPSIPEALSARAA